MAKVETERFFGNKGIIIMIRDGNKFTSAIFKDKKNADKFNRNNPSDVKKLLQLAKKTKFPKGIDEDTDVGHQDDEPNMLKSTALEIMEYGKKLMDKLDKYDDMEGEVDFPNWWQSKLTLARDYVSKAYHYLDSEEKTSETIDRSFRTYRDDEGDDEGPVDEGKKRYYQQDRVGSAKYTISYHDGKKKHKDGSDFFDIQIFKNKKDLAKFVNALHKSGYVYGFNESVNEAKVETERYFGKKGIIIMIRDGNKMVSAIFKDKKNADKFNRNNPSDVKKLLQLAKKTKFPKAIDEKTYGISDDNPVQFEAKYNYKADALTAYFKGKIDAKELDSIARNQFKSGIATKKELSNFLSNKFTQDVMSDTYGIPAGTLVKRVRGLMKFAEGMNEDKKQVKDLIKKVKYEKIFYDVLSTMEKTYGKRKYRIWLEKSLKDFGENPKHYDYRTNAAIEEKLFQLGK